jgi:hypothetical protein
MSNEGRHGEVWFLNFPGLSVVFVGVWEIRGDSERPGEVECSQRRIHLADENLQMNMDN